MLSRRSVIIGSGAVTAAAASRSAWLPSPAHAANPQPLRIPKLIDARKARQSVALKVQEGQFEFYPGRPSRTLGYNGPYLGPTLRVHRGDDVEVAVSNDLREGTTAHWHGLVVPGDVDGGPHQLIRPGTTWRPVLSVRQPAATLFYHSHVHYKTAEQVYSGLAGVMIVADDRDKALGLPSEYGVDDLPLVLQDRKFENGRLVLPGGMMALMHGRRGDTLVVNGTVNPVASVPGKLVRLRLVNGANARTFVLSFDDGREFHWIASDGGLLERSVTLRSISLSPGERIEILADFSDGKAVTMQTAPDPTMPMMMGMFQRLRDSLTSSLSESGEPLIRFEPKSKGRLGVVPDRLVASERVQRSAATRTRRLVLDMGMSGMMPGPMGGMDGGQGGMFAINGRAFDMSRIDERARLGDTEIWQVSGQMMAHPFHMHGVQFEVLSRDGSTPEIRDQGLRDTVLVQEPVELLVRFTQPATKAPFMYHCHILEHEDNGMMGQFAVA